MKRPDLHVVHESSNRKFISRHIKIFRTLALFSSMCVIAMLYKRYAGVGDETVPIFGVMWLLNKEKTVLIERINTFGKSVECRMKFGEFTLRQDKDKVIYEDEIDELFIIPENDLFFKIVTLYGFVKIPEVISENTKTTHGKSLSKQKVSS
ncbi:hypothetical protein RF11_10516 [Thelohanellus kitauei]|uniref:Uncharacterized protein n=1 Tax=Thelohanellus kitauei TaxID=669202 RepID=A0A0C2IV11_THEKT|nr:hypothetical protein RF11_10516 [Thelohanellus kitauei]